MVMRSSAMVMSWGWSSGEVERSKPVLIMSSCELEKELPQHKTSTSISSVIENIHEPLNAYLIDILPMSELHVARILINFPPWTPSFI